MEQYWKWKKSPNKQKTIIKTVGRVALANIIKEVLSVFATMPWSSRAVLPRAPGVCCAVNPWCRLWYPTSMHVGWDCVCPSRFRSSVLSSLKLAPWITLFLLSLLGPPPFALVSLVLQWCDEMPHPPSTPRGAPWSQEPHVSDFVSSVPPSWCYTGLHSSVLQSWRSSSLRPGLAP